MEGGQPNAFVWVALIAFVPAAFVLCSWLGARRGMFMSVLLGWLFLPQFDDAVGRDIPILHQKSMFVPAVVLAVVVLLDLGRLLKYRWSLLDLPVVVLILAWAQSSLTNDMGLYDTGSAFIELALALGVPYLLGRIYAGPGALDELADTLVKGGLIYVPFCLWEIRMSPQLHRTLYGYHQHSFIQHVRYGGFRPMVFMYHGLMVGLFMACATLIAYWLWRSRARRQIWGIPMGWLVPVLAFTTFECKAVGAILLLAVGIGLYEALHRWRRGIVVVLLVLVPPAYCTSRMLGWNGQSLVELASTRIDPQRASSLNDRIRNEDLLIQRALLHPWNGWGRLKFQERDENGQLLTVTDGLWIIVLGVSGIPGLAALLAYLAIPAAVLLRRFRARGWMAPGLAAPASLAAVLLLTSVDNLMNDMRMPFFPIAAGCLVSFLRKRAAPRRLREPAADARASRLPAGEEEPGRAATDDRGRERLPRPGSTSWR